MAIIVEGLIIFLVGFVLGKTNFFKKSLFGE
jgi:hypothetical protein